ncbi:hypothetical protein KP014_13760 [Paenibacillus sophorae]|uniref:Uncharacterized protein n=1 Tax=Paenibacillus sophorae TaxID=1333845 RepID=A0ABX8H4I7_9BACL|nr:hypothetical protein [Paenibacillus sophorae]QWU13104.1 hypothetical protein KP014_13760 [Paenibacillus sophorae]
MEDHNRNSVQSPKKTVKARSQAFFVHVYGDSGLPLDITDHTDGVAQAHGQQSE